MAYQERSGNIQKLKDKKVDILRKKLVEDAEGMPYEYYEYVHKNIWAYYRAASQSETMNAGIAGISLSAIFIVNWTKNITVNDYLEYEGNVYEIDFLDYFEGYKQDLKLTATSIGNLPPLDDDEEPKQLNAPIIEKVETYPDGYNITFQDTNPDVLNILVAESKYRDDRFIEVSSGKQTSNLGGKLFIEDKYAIDVGIYVRLKVRPMANHQGNLKPSEWSETVKGARPKLEKLPPVEDLTQKYTHEDGTLLLEWEYPSKYDNQVQYEVLFIRSGGLPAVGRGKTQNKKIVIEYVEAGNEYKINAVPLEDYKLVYNASDYVYTDPIEAPKEPVKLPPIEYTSGIYNADDETALLSWEYSSEYIGKVGFLILQSKGGMPARPVARTEETSVTVENSSVGATYKIQAQPLEQYKDDFKASDLVDTDEVQ